MNRWKFSKSAYIYQRDMLKLIDFDDFDPIYIDIGALGNVYQGYISEPVCGINS